MPPGNKKPRDPHQFLLEKAKNEAWIDHAAKHGHCQVRYCLRPKVGEWTKCAGHLLGTRLSVRKVLGFEENEEYQETAGIISDDDLFLMAIDEGHKEDWLLKITNGDTRTTTQPVDSERPAQDVAPHTD